ncbi:MAG: ATPase, T2SS/T4P/T4SS family [Candidatus Caenarcaniphilales bacterium]|nr:ATPase, T2SS/T4P/T4SS family [Candidatus Caenarcaniphilales bacterium]
MLGIWGPKNLMSQKNISPIDADFAGIFFKPIAQYLENPDVAEVMVNAHDDIWIEDNNGLRKVPEVFTQDALVSAVNSLAQYVGRPLMENVFSVDARMPDGSRVCIVLPPVSGKDPIFAIRRFKEVVSDLDFLVSKNTLTPEMVSFVEACVKIKKNIMVSGGTSSGKTTLLNLIAAKIPDEDRIITIEDSRELQLHQEHVLSLEGKPSDKHGRGEFSIRQCLKSTLRLRPDRIIVGEIRSGEAFDLVQAMNTGHGGCMGTVHANAPTDTLRRIESLALMADVDMPLIALRSMIASALDLIICPARLSDGSRRIVQIAEIGPLTEKGDYTTTDICRFVSTKRNKDTGKVEGYFEFTGHVPSFFDMFEAEGVDVPREFFRKRVMGPVPEAIAEKLLQKGYEVPEHSVALEKTSTILQQTQEQQLEKEETKSSLETEEETSKEEIQETLSTSIEKAEEQSEANLVIDESELVQSPGIEKQEISETITPISITETEELVPQGSHQIGGEKSLSNNLETEDIQKDEVTNSHKENFANEQVQELSQSASSELQSENENSEEKLVFSEDSEEQSNILSNNETNFAEESSAHSEPQMEESTSKRPSILERLSKIGASQLEMNYNDSPQENEINEIHQESLNQEDNFSSQNSPQNELTDSGLVTETDSQEFSQPPSIHTEDSDSPSKTEQQIQPENNNFDEYQVNTSMSFEEETNSSEQNTNPALSQEKQTVNLDDFQLDQGNQQTPTKNELMASQSNIQEFEGLEEVTEDFSPVQDKNQPTFEEINTELENTETEEAQDKPQTETKQHAVIAEILKRMRANKNTDSTNE